MSPPSKMAVVASECWRHYETADQMSTVCDVIGCYIIGYILIGCDVMKWQPWQINVDVTTADKMEAMMQLDETSLKKCWRHLTNLWRHPAKSWFMLTSYTTNMFQNTALGAVAAQKTLMSKTKKHRLERWAARIYRVYTCQPAGLLFNFAVVISRVGLSYPNQVPKMVGHNNHFLPRKASISSTKNPWSLVYKLQPAAYYWLTTERWFNIFV